MEGEDYLFRVAICDDDMEFCKSFQSMVETCLEDLDIPHKIIVYQSTQNLYYDLEEGVI